MVKKSAKYIFDTLKNLYFRSLLLINFACKGTRQKKKKIWKIPHFGGGGPDPGIFHISKKKK